MKSASLMVVLVLAGATALPVPAEHGPQVIGISGQQESICFLYDNGNVDCAASPGLDYDGGDAIMMDAGWSDVCIVRTNATAHCWQRIGGESRYTAPNATGVIDLAVGQQHACFLFTGGVVHCRGTGPRLPSSLVVGSRSTESLGTPLPPQEVPGIGVAHAVGVVAIDAGEYHTCFTDASRAFGCYGADSNGNRISFHHPPVLAMSTYRFLTCWLPGDGSVGCEGHFGRPAPSHFQAGAVEVTPAAGHVCSRDGAGLVTCSGPLPSHGPDEVTAWGPATMMVGFDRGYCLAAPLGVVCHGAPDGWSQGEPHGV